MASSQAFGFTTKTK
jgi:methylmalonyl-CoA mutase